MSKFVAKFRKEKDYNDEYAFKKNVYERKKQEKRRDVDKQNRYGDAYDVDWSYSTKKHRK